MPKKKSKPRVKFTHYAYQDKATRKWWDGAGYGARTMAGAQLTPQRGDVNEDVILVVPGRWLPLSTRTRASAKRTK